MPEIIGSRFKGYSLLISRTLFNNSSVLMVSPIGWNIRVASIDAFFFQCWRFRKKSDICVVRHYSSLRRTITTPHSSEFARLDLEHFTKPSKFGLFMTSSKLLLAEKVVLPWKGWSIQLYTIGPFTSFPRHFF